MTRAPASGNVNVTNIKVCIRVRPLSIDIPSQPEPDSSNVTSIECWNLKGNIICPNPNYESFSYDQSLYRSKRTAYAFDKIFYPMSKSLTVYNEVVRPVVAAAMEGYHSSVFAYGQTATGKTFTMQGTADDPGIVPLAVHDCFKCIRGSHKTTRDREFLLRMSYMEIYNEQINDLLSPSSLQSIRIYEQRGKGVVVKGMKEEVVISAEQVFALVAAGEAHRHIGSTEMNASSSRSHTIFRLVIESKAVNHSIRGAEDGKSTVRVSTLSLVDLAGSESIKQSNTTGERQKEGRYINKSLLTLGKVIWKLSEGSRRNLNVEEMTAHIPYRDSKLTRLLQPSLGGNAQISIVCNISPEACHVEETHNTLKFASRAKRIQQRASVSVVLDDATLLQQYRAEIDALRTQLSALHQENQTIQTQLMSPGNARASGEEEDDDEEEETQVIIAAIHNLERLILKNVDEQQQSKSAKSHFKNKARKPHGNAFFFESGGSQSAENGMPQQLFFERGGGEEVVAIR